MFSPERKQEKKRDKTAGKEDTDVLARVTASLGPGHFSLPIYSLTSSQLDRQLWLITDSATHFHISFSVFNFCCMTMSIVLCFSLEVYRLDWNFSGISITNSTSTFDITKKSLILF